MKSIGERIRIKRKELKISGIEIKEKCGISTGNLSSIERGKVLPSSNALIELSKILECSIDYILTGKEYRKEETYQSYQELTEEERNIILKMRTLKDNDIDFIKDMIETRYKKTIKERKEKFSNSPEESHGSGEIIA